MNGKRPRDGGVRHPAAGRYDDAGSLLIRSQKLGLTRDPAFARILAMLQMNPRDIQALEFVRDAVARAETIDAYSPDPFRATNPASPADLPGAIGLGLVSSTGVPWCIDPDILTSHMGILGRSGGGKTNFILLFLVQLLEMRRA